MEVEEGVFMQEHAEEQVEEEEQEEEEAPEDERIRQEIEVSSRCNGETAGDKMWERRG